MSLKAEERKEEIMELLLSQGKIDTAKLAEEVFEVSYETVRRDLKQLEEENKLKRVYGGAVKKKLAVEHNKREDILQKEKKQIGREAAKLVEDNNVLVLDEGTTVSRMIEFVVQKNNLEIFTCDFSIANTLMEYKNNGIFNGEIYFVGGKVNSKHQRTSGFLSQKFMDSFHVDKVFFTTTGLIPEYGLSDYYYDKGLLTKKFIDIADEKILLADHSKIGVKTTFSFCELEKINYIISDVSMPSNFKENIKDIKWIKAE